MSTRTVQDIADDIRALKIDYFAAEVACAQREADLWDARRQLGDIATRLVEVRCEFEKLTDIEIVEATTN